MAKASYDLEHDTIVDSKDVLVEEENFLDEALLEESHDVEIVEVVPCDVELLIPSLLSLLLSLSHLYCLTASTSYIVSLFHRPLNVHLNSASDLCDRCP